MMDDEILTMEKTGPIARLTLNRPEKRNALSLALLADLERALDRIGDDREIRVLILGANGPAFCSGHDLREIADLNEARAADLFRACSRVMLKLRGLPQPAIAKVQGIASAAGCQLALSCDLAIASERASFATPGVKIGLFCSTPMVPLTRAVPPKLAMEMLLTGEPVAADHAREMGLINRVAPHDQLDRETEALASAVASASGAVLRVGKAAFHRQCSLSESQAYDRMIGVMAANLQWPDAREGIAAFLEKRTPLWPPPSSDVSADPDAEPDLDPITTMTAMAIAMKREGEEGNRR